MRLLSGHPTLAAASLDEMTEDRRLEKVFGSEWFQSLGWFKDALERCRAAARIEDQYEEGIGPGFLVEETALHASFPPIVLMTNAYVFPDAISQRRLSSPSAPLTTSAALKTGGTRSRTCCGHHRETSSTRRFVSLKSAPPGVAPCPTARVLPPLKSEPPPRAFNRGPSQRPHAA